MKKRLHDWLWSLLGADVNHVWENALNYTEKHARDLRATIDELRTSIIAHKNEFSAHKSDVAQTMREMPERVSTLVHEELANIQSVKERHVACPICGKSFNLQGLGIPYHTRSVTITCNNCSNQFEVRPGLFWNKLEVERR